MTERSELQITYGEWEHDPDALPIYAGEVPWGGGHIVLRPENGGWRRARYESWMQDGQKWGRRTWERRSA